MKKKHNLELQLLLAEALFLTFSERDGKSIAQWRNPAGQFASPYDEFPNVLKDEATTDEFEIALDKGLTGDAIGILTEKGVSLATATKFTSFALRQRLKQWKEKVPSFETIANYIDVGAIDVTKDILNANGLQKGKIDVLFEEWEAITGKRSDRPILDSTEEVINLYTLSETALDDAKAILELESPEEMLLALMSRGVSLERLDAHGWLKNLGLKLDDIPKKAQNNLPLLVEFLESQARSRLLALAGNKGDGEFLDKLRPLPIPTQKYELQKKGYTPQQIRAYLALDKKMEAIEKYNHVMTKKTVDTIKSLIPPDIMTDERQVQFFFEGLEKGVEASKVSRGIFGVTARIFSGKGNKRLATMEERIREFGFREDDPWFNAMIVNAEVGQGLDIISNILSTSMLAIETGGAAFGAVRALNILLRATNPQMVKNALVLATRNAVGTMPFEPVAPIKTPVNLNPSLIESLSPTLVPHNLVSKVIRVPEMIKTVGTMPELNSVALGDAIKTTLDPAVKRSLKDVVRLQGGDIDKPSASPSAATVISSFFPPATLGYLNGLLTCNMIANSNHKVFQEMRKNFQAEPLSEYISKVQQLVAQHGLQEISFDMEKIVKGDFSELKSFISEMEKASS